MNINSNVNDYVIAIPSYKRNETLKKKTMRVLNEYNIPRKKIFIFVSDKNQQKLYEDTLEPKSYNKIVVGKPGIQHIRNFMPKYFPEGKPIVYMDDDISKISKCNNNNIDREGTYDKKDNKLETLNNLDKFIKDAFKMSKKTGYTNWGVYPTDNPYFMKPTMKNNKHVTNITVTWYTNEISNCSFWTYVAASSFLSDVKTERTGGTHRRNEPRETKHHRISYSICLGAFEV